MGILMELAQRTGAHKARAARNAQLLSGEIRRRAAFGTNISQAGPARREEHKPHWSTTRQRGATCDVLIILGSRPFSSLRLSRTIVGFVRVGGHCGGQCQECRRLGREWRSMSLWCVASWLSCMGGWQRKRATDGGSKQSETVFEAWASLFLRTVGFASVRG